MRRGESSSILYGHRIRTALAWAILALAQAASALAAPDLPTSVQAFDVAYRDWMDRYGVTRGSLAVVYGRRLVLANGYGGQAADTPTLLGSLSKAITAVCTATLIRDGKLRLSTTLGEALAPFFRQHGEPVDARVKTITIEQLLTHRAGYLRNSDPATGPQLAQLLRWVSPREPAMAELLRSSILLPLPTAPGGAYSYSNTHYLILGVVVETIAGRAYEDYCRSAVLVPLGIRDARLEPDWRILSSFGGWSLSGPQYLTFLKAFDADNPLGLDQEIRTWTLAAEGKWTTEQKSIFYSLGVRVRPTTRGFNLSHTGSWRYDMKGAFDGHLYASTGTLAVRADDDTAWFASFSPRPAENSLTELDRQMWRARRSVKDWPAGDGFPALGLK